MAPVPAAAFTAQNIQIEMGIMRATLNQEFSKAGMEQQALEGTFKNAVTQCTLDKKIEPVKILRSDEAEE